MAVRNTPRDYPAPGANQCDLETVGLATPARPWLRRAQPLAITAKDRETTDVVVSTRPGSRRLVPDTVGSSRIALASPSPQLRGRKPPAQKVGNAMSTFVVLEFQTKPDKVEAVKEFLRKVLPDTRNYAGYESLVLHQNQDDPTSMMMYEQWSTRPQYDAYLAWRIDTGTLAEFAEMLTGPPSFRFFDLVDA